ncbi:helix-hairpin-helix domain-containing protein [Faecalimonas sp.]
MRRKLYYCLGICIMICIFASCQKKETVQLEEVKKNEAPQKKEKDVEKIQVVYVCGAVQKPGVYRMPAGSRIYEAIEMAGGMTEQADEAALNQAEKVKDAEQIYVPEKVNEKAEEEKLQKEDGKINLNTATEEELMSLPGIGQSKAKSIIQYREKKGRFQSVEEIMQIEGIKSGVFNKIKEQIVVR